MQCEDEAAAATTVIGSYLSPYVRKVLVCLALKGVAYRIDPIVPFYGDDEFRRLSPLRRVPVLIDDEVTLTDSTVICEYLEERYPSPPLLPPHRAQRARARWLEEFADSRMGEVFIWHYYNQLVIRRFVWGEVPDAEVVRKAREEEMPDILDYLEAQLAGGGFGSGVLSIAEVAVASFFRNAAFARYEVDATRWPLVAAFLVQTLSQPAFARLRPFEELCLRTPVAGHRAALAAAGAPVTAQTVGTLNPRRGVMSI